MAKRINFTLINESTFICLVIMESIRSSSLSNIFGIIRGLNGGLWNGAVRIVGVMILIRLWLAG